MSGAVRTLTASCVILPGRVWVEELAGELTRLGIDPEQAPTSATTMLQHICGRAGWPREVFRVADSIPADENMQTLSRNRPEEESAP